MTVRLEDFWFRYVPAPRRALHTTKWEHYGRAHSKVDDQRGTLSGTLSFEKGFASHAVLDHNYRSS